MEKLYLSGAGVMMTRQSGGGLLRFGTIQNLSLTTSATFKDLFAGAGLFPVVSRGFDKSIEASCDIAAFDASFIEISQGLASEDPTTIERFEDAEEQTVESEVVTVDKESYKAGYTYVEDHDGNKMTLVVGAPAAAIEYQESDPDTGELTFHEDQDDEKVYISYVYDYNYTSNVDNVDALVLEADVLPKEFQLFFRSTLNEGGGERGVEIVFWRCKPMMDMKLNFTRDFNIPNFSFRILDPSGPDKRIGHYILL